MEASNRMRRILTFALATALACALSPAPAHAALSPETLRGYIARVGAKIESTKGNMFVTTMPVRNARVEIRILNDARKNRLGLYAYGFGNVTGASDKGDLLEYLLKANSELGVGSFFVDKDDDIGYKALLDTGDPLSYQTFQVVYLAMVQTIAEHGPEIARRAGGVKRDRPSDDAPGEDGEARGAAVRSGADRSRR
jgi:hypothetical protein